MSHERDTDRVIEAWLAEGPDLLADQVLDTIGDQIRHTPQQQRLHVPWRNRPTHLLQRSAALAAVLAVAVAVSGALLFSRLGSQQGGFASPVPTAHITELPSPRPSATPGQATPASSSSTTPSPSSSAAFTKPTAEFAGGGLRFSYPAGWARYDVGSFSTMGSTIAVLGTPGIADACPRPLDINCVYAYRLAPGELRIVVGTGASPLADFLADRPADAARFTVDGLPGYVTTTEDCFGATECRDAVLALPGSVDNWYELHLSLAAPRLEPDRADFEALLASIHYEQPVDRLPTDPKAEAGAVLRRVLAENTEYASQAGYQLPAYSCFPTEPGATSTVTIAISGGGPATASGHRLDVRCTSAVEATELELWRVTLTTSWDDGPGRRAGSHVETDWVKPNGDRAGTYQTGDDFPNGLSP